MLKSIASLFGSLELRKAPPSGVFLSRVVAIFALFIGAYGLYLRSGDQAVKNFWVDELWRAVSIVNAQGLFDQEFPVQLSELFLGKLGLWGFGQTEIAFRIWPLIFSGMALVLFGRLVCEIFSPPVALGTLFLFAISPGLVEHAHEFKPYSFEVLLALSALLYFRNRPPNYRTGTVRLLIILLGVALFSNLLPFYLLILVPVHLFREGEPVATKVKSAALLTVLPLAAFLLLKYSYALKLEDKDVFRAWSEYYLNSPEQVGKMFREIIPEIMNWYVLPLVKLHKLNPLWTVFLLVAITIISPFLMLLRRNILGLFVIVPLAIQLVLSVLGLYPALTRVSTFYLPFLILSLGYLIDSIWIWICRTRSNSINLVATIITGLLILNYSLHHSRETNPGYSRHIQQIRPLLELVQYRSAIDDVICLAFQSRLASEFYKFFGDSGRVIEGLPDKKNFSEADATKYLDFTSQHYPKRFIWMVGMHRVQPYPYLKAEALRRGMKIEFDIFDEGVYLLGVQQQ